MKNIIQWIILVIALSVLSSCTRILELKGIKINNEQLRSVINATDNFKLNATFQNQTNKKKIILLANYRIVIPPETSGKLNSDLDLTVLNDSAHIQINDFKFITSKPLKIDILKKRITYSVKTDSIVDFENAISISYKLRLLRTIGQSIGGLFKKNELNAKGPINLPFFNLEEVSLVFNSNGVFLNGMELNISDGDQLSLKDVKIESLKDINGIVSETPIVGFKNLKGDVGNLDIAIEKGRFLPNTPTNFETDMILTSIENVGINISELKGIKLINKTSNDTLIQINKLDNLEIKSPSNLKFIKYKDFTHLKYDSIMVQSTNENQHIRFIDGNSSIDAKVGSSSIEAIIGKKGTVSLKTSAKDIDVQDFKIGGDSPAKVIDRFSLNSLENIKNEGNNSIKLNGAKVEFNSNEVSALINQKLSSLIVPVGFKGRVNLRLLGVKFGVSGKYKFKGEVKNISVGHVQFHDDKIEIILNPARVRFYDIRRRTVGRYVKTGAKISFKAYFSIFLNMERIDNSRLYDLSPVIKVVHMDNFNVNDFPGEIEQSSFFKDHLTSQISPKIEEAINQQISSLGEIIEEATKYQFSQIYITNLELYSNRLGFSINGKF